MCALSDDTDTFVLLVRCVYWADIQLKVQMECWDGIPLDVGATCADLGLKCLLILGMHALSGFDTSSYPGGKGNITGLHTLLRGNFPEVVDVLDEVDATKADFLKAGNPLFLAMYGQKLRTSMESPRIKFFIKNKKKSQN